mgnify:CR=1 FL=1
MRIEDALQQFVMAGQGTRWGSARTAEWYQHQVERYFVWVQTEGAQAAWLQATTIERFLAAERMRGLSPYTLRARYVALDAFFGYLVKRELLGEHSNPMVNIDRPKLPKDRRPKNVELAEFRRLLEAVELASWIGLRDRVILQLLFFSGLRVSELIGLRAADVTSDGLVFVRSGKGNKDRMVPCLPGLRTDMLAYLFSRPAYDGPELFLANDGAGGLRGPLTTEGVRQMLRRRCKKLGIRVLNPHAFRHGAAMTLLNEGLEMSAVSTVLGHSSVKVTEQFYARWQVEKLQEQYNKVVGKL